MNIRCLMMNRLIVSLFLLFSVAFPFKSTQKIVKKIQDSFESTSTIQIEFEQIFYWSTSETLDTLSGSFFLNPEKKYRIITPAQEILFDGENVWTYNKVNQQIIVDKQYENENFNLKILWNDWNEYFDVNKHPDSRENVIALKMVPKSEDTLVRDVKVFADQNTWRVFSLVQKDLNGNVTTIYIRSCEEIQVEKDYFNLIFSESAEIIDLR
ncbi:outer membrane lipoprotein carrier protein LolA [bacterium]|nr:outer membrane lipoprotein carrier protein LolA [bacterium]